MRKVLAANETLTIAVSTTDYALEKCLIALLEGDIQYRTDQAVGVADADAFVLNEDVRTDTITARNVYIKAGASGATIQYRVE